MSLQGLILWLGAGVGVGIVLRYVLRALLPGVGTDRGLVGSALLGAGGGLLGGVVATLLGFGGLAALDGRSFTLAALAALAVLLADRWLSSLGQTDETEQPGSAR